MENKKSDSTSWQAKRGNLLLEDEKPVIASEAWQSSFKVTKVWITSHSLAIVKVR